MEQHHTTTDALVHCIRWHLDDLVDRLGTPMAAAERFNVSTPRLFGLTFDEEYGVWLLRPVA